MKFYPLHSLQSTISSSTPTDVVSSLFEKTSKLALLQREFSKVLLMQKQKREKWVDENQDMIEQLIVTFQEESSITLNDVLQTEQGKIQVTEFMVMLQQTLSTLEQIVFEGQKSKD